ncbi:hypothetical protein G6L68_09420 [Agrobacterium fabrum]|uniref:hypothetical protein n=1 Tax=Agrobacterium fabrum TaxID=1176649 RepID=UPI0013CF176F|nr:hypothetical protein [Agrobacterium fabrum]NTE60862.1 hypothetical protein [Agrobacterium fabrum]
MLDREFLKAGNPRKILSNYRNFAGEYFSNAVEDQLRKHVHAIFRLALHHFEFAERQRSQEWRQKVSRNYYACYNASKALRFQVEGAYSTDVSDHKKIGDLPDDFPNRDYFKNKIETMRTDRNSCDYDHAVAEEDLIDSSADIAKITHEF